MKRIIAIVAGGDSSEHDVSMRSAQGIKSFLENQPYDTYIVEVRGTNWNAHLNDGTSAPVDRNDFSFVDGGKRIRPDFSYITIHGTPGENGIIEGYFDLIDMPYSTSDVLVEAMTFNKYALNQFLRSLGVSISDSVLLRKNQPRRYTNEEIVERLGLPCFVKPNAGGSSFGVSKVKEADELEPAIQKAMAESPEVMVESFMKGTEITCGCYKTSKTACVFPITNFSITMPNITDRSRKSLPPVSHPKQQSASRKKRSIYMNCSVAEESSALTTFLRARKETKK